MLVLAAPDISKMLGVIESKGAFNAYDGYFSQVAGIILRNVQPVTVITVVPYKLSAAMIGAFKAMGGRVESSAETSYAQWQQYSVCAAQAIYRYLSPAAPRPRLSVKTRAVRRVSAFFVSQKVNGRNAP